jgi:hypothetical protein
MIAGRREQGSAGGVKSLRRCGGAKSRAKILVRGRQPWACAERIAAKIAAAASKEAEGRAALQSHIESFGDALRLFEDEKERKGNSAAPRQIPFAPFPIRRDHSPGLNVRRGR